MIVEAFSSAFKIQIGWFITSQSHPEKSGTLSDDSYFRGLKFGKLVLSHFNEFNGIKTLNLLLTCPN